jgi:hypothetical protein
MHTAKRRAEDLYSDIFMPAETIAIRREARQFAEDVIRPNAYELNTTPEARDTFPRALYDALAKEGLYRIPYPADVGGGEVSSFRHSPLSLCWRSWPIFRQVLLRPFTMRRRFCSVRLSSTLLGHCVKDICRSWFVANL